MACRKDGKGRVLRKGEGYRKGDGRYSYVYIDPLGKKRTIYAKSLVRLREREEQLQKDQLDGLDIYVAGKADVNFLFDRYISTKTELRSTTYSNYLYTWNHFIRDTFGKKKVRDVKYSDVLFFYTDLINNQGLQINTLETINTVLRPTFQLAVRDDIIRKNPVDGAYCEVKSVVVVPENKASVDCGSAEKIHGVCSKESVLLSLVSILCIFVRNWMQNRRSNWDTLG